MLYWARWDSCIRRAYLALKDGEESSHSSCSCRVGPWVRAVSERSSRNLGRSPNDKHRWGNPPVRISPPAPVGHSCGVGELKPEDDTSADDDTQAVFQHYGINGSSALR